MMMTFNYVFSYWYLKEGLLCGHPTRPYHWVHYVHTKVEQSGQTLLEIMALIDMLLVNGYTTLNMFV